MISSTYIKRVYLLFFAVSLMFSCKTVTGNLTPRDPSDIPYHMAKTKNNARAFWQFISRYPESKHVEEAKDKLADLLIEDKDKEELHRYTQFFPEKKHLVVDVLKEIEIMEKINEYFTTDIPNGARVMVNPGEVVYTRGFLKAYAGHQEELGLLSVEEDEDDSGEEAEKSESINKPSYEIRLEALHASDFIKFELLTDKSFAMAEKFNALANIYCKVTVSPDTPPGIYRPSAIIGVYQLLSPGEEYRKGGKEITLTLEVVKPDLSSLDLLEMDFEAVKYFREKEEKIQQELNKLKPPEGKAFGLRYMYKYNLENYTFNVNEYKAAQAAACYHLQQVADKASPEIAAVAKSYIENLQKNKLFVKYEPVN